MKEARSQDVQFQVRRDNFPESRLVETANDEESLADGEVLAKIDRFALTANNVTYAAAGDQIGYWQFFPPAPEVTGDGDAEGWGVVPVWGFADIVASKHGDVPVGDRLYGYFPPASHLKIQPTKVSSSRLVDGSEHRSQLPPVYNNYQRVLNEPGYDSKMDNLRMLLWPLHVTSFCLWDSLQYNDWYGATQVVIVSASSKTSLGLAYGLHADDSAPATIGVTSSGNLDFVTGLGLYDKALTYDDLSSLDATLPTVIVDMSGNGKILAGLHQALGDNMVRTINVGLTHWGEAGPVEGINTERSEFFFAPSHIQMRTKEWGPEGFAERSAAFLKNTSTRSGEWLEMREVKGLADLGPVFADLCLGKIPANQGLIVEP